MSKNSKWWTPARKRLYRRTSKQEMKQAWLKASKELRDDGFLSKSDFELMELWFNEGFKCARGEK